jgi:hypothetical protein
VVESVLAAPDPYDGSYDLTNPQSLNRYSYVQNDPVNFTDPTGLFGEGPGRRSDPFNPGQCYTLVFDGIEVGTVGNCGGGGGLSWLLSPLPLVGGEDPEPPPNSSQEKKSACANFVDRIVGLFDKVKDYSTKTGKQFLSQSLAGITLENFLASRNDPNYGVVEKSGGVQ